MKRTTQYDHEDYHAIATDPRGIVQSHHISKDKALELVAQGYMMSPDRKHFAGRWSPCHLINGRVCLS